MTSPSAFPLCWPTGLARTRVRERSPFKVPLDRAVADLQNTLRLFGNDTGRPVTGLVISSNVTLGIPKPGDPGVAIYFQWDGLPRAIGVDLFDSVAGNVRAIYMILEGRRTELRYGGLNLVRATFSGFSALHPPPPEHADEPWWHVLGIRPDASLDDIEKRYRDLARSHHPDSAGGSAAVMAKINTARDAARRARAS